nr:MAG TPA: Tail tube protein [Caudoviricetes sp.]
MGKAIIITDLTFATNIGKVTINSEIPSVIEITGINIVGKSSTIQDSVQLSVSYAPANTTQKGVTWRSSDETIATVSVSGYVTVKKGGTVTITAISTYNSQLSDSFTANCSVTQTHIPVTSISLSGNNRGNVGETMQLTASVLPVNATNKNVAWNSNNETLATVDDSGLVTLKAEGSVIITATSVSETSVSNSISITITAESISGSAVEVYNTYLSASGRTSTSQLLNMLNELKDNGLLDKMSELYYLAGNSYQQVKFNIIDTTQALVIPSSNSANFTINADGIKSADSTRNYLLTMNTILPISDSFIAQCGKDYGIGRWICGYKTSMWEIAIQPNLESGNILRLISSNQLSATPDNKVEDGATVLALSGDKKWYYDNSKGSYEGTYDPKTAEVINEPGILFMNDGTEYTSNPGISVKFACCGSVALTKTESLKLRELFDKYYILL